MAKTDNSSSGGNAKNKKKNQAFNKKIKTEQLTVFTRQLATLLQAGLPLLRATQILCEQERDPNFRNALETICDNIQSGNSLSDALSQFPRMFDRLYINMIKAGEAGGVLDTVLDRLAMFQEKSERIKKKVKSAMVYPCVVICVAGVIVYLLLTFVVPSFQSMIASQGGQMPALTEFVMNIGNGLREHWLLTIIGFALLIFGGRFAFKNQKVCAMRDRALFRMPKIGTFLQTVTVSRFCRTFGTLMSSGVPILQAMKRSTTASATGIRSPRRSNKPRSSRRWFAPWCKSVKKPVSSRKCSTASPTTTTKKWTTPSAPSRPSSSLCSWSSSLSSSVPSLSRCSSRLSTSSRT